MRLGVDLDNTLVCYDEAFLNFAREQQLVPEDWRGNKRQVRKYLREQSGDDEAWQRLQGQVYGKEIGKARLFPGVYRFLWRCKSRGIIVDVISHKSEFGHFDQSRTPLRASAIGFLEKAGIFCRSEKSLINSVEFCSTREEKIASIARAQFDWFVDDLPEILDDAEFPQNTVKFGYSPDRETSFLSAQRVASWVELEDIVLGHWSLRELGLLAGEVIGKDVQDVGWIGGRGNSGIAKFCTAEGVEAALKIYSDDTAHIRLHAEFESFKILRHYGEKRIPEGLGFCSRLNVGVYRWIVGEPVSLPDQSDISQTLEFLERIHYLREKPEFKSFPSASAAVFSGWQLEQQIRQRIFLLRANTNSSLALSNYLDNSLVPVYETILCWCRSRWPGEGFDQPISVDARTLSPSDFGFHNALRIQDGNLHFLDFEYFGWDDPAKLAGDVLFHPAMKLPANLKEKWTEGIRQIYGPDVIVRLRIMWGLIGISWCLILLNEFRADYWLRRTRAIGNEQLEQSLVLEKQLDCSRCLLSEIKSNYQNPLYL